MRTAFHRGASPRWRAGLGSANLTGMRDPRFRPGLAAQAHRQLGLVTYPQAIAAGYTPAEIRRLISSDGWVTVRRGVFATREVWDVTPARGHAWLRDAAAHLLMTRAHLLSHDSAARGWGLALLRGDELSHITRPGVGGSRTEHGVKHHLARVQPARVGQISGIPVTGLARTGLDVAREHGFAAGVVTLDAARRLGATDVELRAELALMRSWPGVVQARAAYEFSDAGAESPGESLTRIALVELGLGHPVTQFAVEVDGRPAWCDLRVGCHVFEFDGRVKYRRRGDGGLATRALEEVLWQERLRENAIRAQGLGVSRIVWPESSRGRAAWSARAASLGVRPHRPASGQHAARSAGEVRRRPSPTSVAGRPSGAGP